MIARPLARRPIARSFGRGRPYVLAAPVPADTSAALGDDLQLFATWFLGGFLFMSIYLA